LVLVSVAALAVLLLVIGMLLSGRVRRLKGRSWQTRLDLLSTALMMLYELALVGQIAFIVREGTGYAALVALKISTAVAVGLAVVSLGLKQRTGTVVLVVISGVLIAAAGIVSPEFSIAKGECSVDWNWTIPMGIGVVGLLAASFLCVVQQRRNASAS
jgi:hypothetical protein